MQTFLVVASLAHASPTTFDWQLSVDGVPVGTRTVRLHTEGSAAERMHFHQAYTSIEEGDAKRGAPAAPYQHRLTASGPIGQAPSFFSTQRIGDRGTEVQARLVPGGWRVTVTNAVGEENFTVRRNEVDMSTMDLFDPNARRDLASRDLVRLLDVTTGRVTEFAVVSMSPRQVTVGNDTVWADGWELRSADASWRLHMTSSGVLVRLDAPLGGRRVIAELQGPMPRADDDFEVGILPSAEIEEIETPPM